MKANNRYRGTTSGYLHHDWGRVESAIRQVCSLSPLKDDVKKWIGKLHMADWHALAALILSLLPNFTKVSLHEYNAPRRHLSDHSDVRYLHTIPTTVEYFATAGISFQSLKVIEIVTWQGNYGSYINISSILLFLRIKSVKKTRLERIMSSVKEDKEEECYETEDLSLWSCCEEEPMIQFLRRFP